MLQWFLLLHLQQIPLWGLISMTFPKGSLDAVPSAEASLTRQRWCTLSATTSSPTQKPAGMTFSLTGRSLFLPGIWHCFLSPAAFHQRRTVGQNKPCKQGDDALQKEKADLRNIWISKVSHLMSPASWSYKAGSSITVFSYLAGILQPAFSGDREIRITATTTKRKNVSCLASVKFMGTNRMLLLNRWWALPGLKSSAF